ncbi:MAG: hypothetical protein R3F65_06275 [bacterium]|nr:hypothetical protein [Myxococcales bacterium]MCB9553269.1 hypothetical protein [Myxococcales bacterium]
MSAVLPIITHPVYLLACFLVGVMGRKRRVGFFGAALLSLLLTPVLMFFVLFAGAEKRRPIDDDEEVRPVR